MPGRIVQALKQAGAMNPVFMLDEIDKIAAGYPGRSGGRAARGARPGAEPLVPRSLPRECRSTCRACCSSRPRTSSARSIRRCSTAWRSSRWPATPRRKSSTSRGAILIPRQMTEHGLPAGRRSRSPTPRFGAVITRVHARSRRPEPRAADRRDRPQGRRARGDRGRRPTTAADDRRRRRRRAPTISGRRDSRARWRSARRGPASPPAWRGPRPAATCCSSKRPCFRAATRTSFSRASSAT